MSSIDTFVKYLNESRRIVVLTGAGMSTESGIPDFRSPTGLWTKYDPDEYATVEAFFQNPQKVWSFFKELYSSLKNTTPNQGHIYLAEIERWKRSQDPEASFVVITQNIDGFHQIAGSTDVIELHGNAQFVECVNCSERYNSRQIFDSLDQEMPPRCPECGGLLKLAVTLFGEPLPFEAFQRARQESEQSDLFIVLGSSLVVSPANLLVLASSGKKVLINLDATPYDHVFDLIFHERITLLLEQVISRIGLRL